MYLTDKITTSDFTLVFRALPGLYVLLTPDFTIADLTERYAAKARIDANKAIGKSIFEILPANGSQTNEHFRNGIRASLDHVVSHKEPHNMPYLQISFLQPNVAGNNAKEYCWRITNTPILGKDGELLHILHQTEDITETVRQEQLHQQNEEKLAMLTNALHTVSWEYDILNDILTWDNRLKLVFGYAPEDMDPSGSSWDRLVHPEDYQHVQQSIARATASGQKLWTGEYRLRKADGTYAHVLDQGYFVYDKSNRPLRTFGTIIDLSQNKRAEEELRESDARFRQLLENLPHMAWTADHKGKVLFFNDNWYNFTGMPKGQTEGWASVIHPEDAATVLTTWHDAVMSGSLYEMDYRIWDHITGTYRYFMVRAVPMVDEHGKIRLWVGTFTDIEDQKQTLESIRLKDQQLQSILQLSPAHLCLLEGPNHVCRFVSPGVYSIYGNRTYIGATAHDIWPEFRQLGLSAILDRVFQQGQAEQRNEIRIMYDRFQRGKPKEAYFNFDYQPVFGNHGQVEGVLISAIEVTEIVQEKHETARQLAELRQKLG